MLRKIKNIIIKLFCFWWISLICLMGVAPKDDAGAGMNGFLVFGLWILCIFIMIKIRLKKVIQLQIYLADGIIMMIEKYKHIIK